MLRLNRSALRGVVTQHGGVTSHVVILAKALGIPAIVGVADAVQRIRDGDLLQLNAFTGEVDVNADAERRRYFAKLERAYAAERRRSEEAAREPALTLDGHAVRVLVNTGDAVSLRAFSPEICDGIGLFRTEFLYLNASSAPSEETQFKIYTEAVERARGKDVVFRTTDCGADKAAGYMNLPAEANPLLGYRAIRVSLDNPVTFGAQLRAVLRASAYGNVKLMFPMVVTLQELRDAKLCLENEKQRLRDMYVPFDENIPVGVMIETPAAVMISDRLAMESAFFSVGTNDLVQYVTASDRVNERVHHLFDPCNPAVLRMLLMVAENAAAAHIPWGVCGEAAGEERLVPLWVAMGASYLSVSPGCVGAVKRVIGAFRRDSAKEWLNSAMMLESGGEINAYLDNVLNRMAFKEFAHGL
jgi:phosphotransferase system enzyme I (PtsI)